MIVRSGSIINVFLVRLNERVDAVSVSVMLGPYSYDMTDLFKGGLLLVFCPSGVG